MFRQNFPIYTLEDFGCPKLVHGFSTREFGDLKVTRKTRENLNNFLKILEIDVNDLVTMEQVHQDKIEVVDTSKKSKVVVDVDGLVTKNPGTILAVNTADCLPILFYDFTTKICACVHGGWKAILKRIAQKTVKIMMELGAAPQNIRVGIGPHIGVCCYNVTGERKKLFEKEFGPDSLMIKRRGKKIFLNLSRVAAKQLMSEDILLENIKISPICTFCQNDLFYSFRKEGKGVGEMMGVIGFKRTN